MKKIVLSLSAVLLFSGLHAQQSDSLATISITPPPSVEAIAAEVPSVEAIAAEIPTVDSIAAGVPSAEAIATGIPAIETLQPADSLAGKTSAVEIPAADLPTTEVGVTEAETATELEEPKANPMGKYRRSSLYTILMRHPAAKYGNAIDSAFRAIPTPDKFNNHDLTPKSFDAMQKRNRKDKDEDNKRDIEEFIATNALPRGLVAKWFNRNPEDGTFDMELIQKRGYYDASQLDITLADQGYLGRAVLADAGEELISKTFLLVNDITFIDKGEKSAKAGGWMRLVGSVASIASGQDFSGLTDAAATLVNEIDGFSVNITSYLYRLHWNEEVAANFYTYHWMDASAPDVERKAAFEASPLFRVAYVGRTTTSAGNLASKSFAKSKEQQMLRVCTRAIDKSIVQLQRDFDEFKVNVPLYGINEDGTVDVQIGLKEGLNSKSQFDVLMPVLDQDGRMSYEKVGRIAPIEGKIWDNRYGADEDAAAMAEEAAKKGSGKKNASKAAADVNADEPLGNVALTASTFKVTSGANKIVPGCLVREVTIKRE